MIPVIIPQMYEVLYIKKSTSLVLKVLIA